MYSVLRHLGDRKDERRARWQREQFGRRRWLVSWQPLARGRWLARLSCPERPETFEATGRTRREAISAAERALLDALTHPPGSTDEIEPGYHP